MKQFIMMQCDNDYSLYSYCCPTKTHNSFIGITAGFLFFLQTDVEGWIMFITDVQSWNQSSETGRSNKIIPQEEDSTDDWTLSALVTQCWWDLELCDVYLTDRGVGLSAGKICGGDLWGFRAVSWPANKANYR